MDFSQFKITKRGVYLYVFRQGSEPKVYKGNIYTLKTKLTKLISPTFRESGKHKKRYASSCSLEPGKLYNGVVWLRERDDYQAKDLYFQYVREKLEAFKRKANDLNEYCHYVLEHNIKSYILED